MVITNKKMDYLVVDTTAFIQNAPLQSLAQNIVTVQDVVNEITNKRQLKRLVVLPYDLVIKNVYPENIAIVSDFAKKTGDYLNLSATDIKVIALTYQLEKEHVGVDHLRKEPITKSVVSINSKKQKDTIMTGFFMSTKENKTNTQIMNDLQKSENVSDTELIAELDAINIKDDISVLPSENEAAEFQFDSCDDEIDDECDDIDNGWITPSNVHEVKQQINADCAETVDAKVACLTTDFAMQNVLKQMNLNVSALDGKIIKLLKTYILRCYSCFKTTSVMTQQFCPKCGNNTLKRVSVSVDSNGKQKIHINARHPLTARGKRFSLPTVQGGKHSNNPVLTADQPIPDQKPTRLARTKNNPLSDDYIAGYSPFVMRDINSKSAQLGIRSVKEVKHWMRKNPNQARK